MAEYNIEMLLRKQYTSNAKLRREKYIILYIITNSINKVCKLKIEGPSDKYTYCMVHKNYFHDEQILSKFI